MTAVDFSAAQVDRARAFWADEALLAFVRADACAFLDDDTRVYEAIYSTWGAVWFTDPEELFPRVAARLAAGGVFGFSHREPVAGQYGAQRMGGKWLEGRETDLTILRWQYGAEQWADILEQHGFAAVRTEVLPNSDRAALGTLLVTAKV